MASGYVTSDGKDLDSRYLGIKAKAASASKADTATTASGLASGVDVSKNALLNTLKRVNVSVGNSDGWDKARTYTFTATGLFHLINIFSDVASGNPHQAGYIKLGSATLWSSAAGSDGLVGNLDKWFFVKKGAVLTYYGGGYSRNSLTGELLVTAT